MKFYLRISTNVSLSIHKVMGLTDVLHVFYFFVHNFFLVCGNYCWMLNRLLITFANTLDPDQDQTSVLIQSGQS